MFVNNDMYISSRFTRRDYVNLSLNLDSSPELWRRAVIIFSDRIQGRYLNPVRTLIENDCIRNGFAAMSLLCLLIDTFMQFRLGLPQSENGSSKWNYVNFMNEYLNIRKNVSYQFYSDIRCGLLHSAETKNGSYLVPDDNTTIERIYMNNNKTVIKVSVRSLYIAIERYFRNYCHELLDMNSVECRKNFVTKMDDITLKNDVLNGDFELWAAICQRAGSSFVQGNKNAHFSYFISKFEQAVIIYDKTKITIPFSDIKHYLYYPKAIASHYIDNGYYIDSIINEFPEVVKRYMQNNAA